MKFIQHYSSSTGNLYEVVANNDERLLIECGCTWKKLQKAIGFNLRGIRCALLSHEHADHSKAVKDIMKAGIDVYSSPGTFEALGLTDHRRAIAIKPARVCCVGDFQFFAFEVEHDAVQPYGYVIKVDNEYLLFVTDTYLIRARFKFPFSIIAFEASYDKKMLQEQLDAGEIDKTLATRLLTSHQEIRTAYDYVSKYCDRRRLREIHLLHMSEKTQDKAKTKKMFAERLYIDVVTI